MSLLDIIRDRIRILYKTNPNIHVNVTLKRPHKTKLREVAQRLYKEWFIYLRYPDYEDVDIIDGLPEGWSNATVLLTLHISQPQD